MKMTIQRANSRHGEAAEERRHAFAPGAISLPKTTGCRPALRGAAFTLIEVMIASAILFIGLFAILGLTSQSLRAAYLLKQDGPNAGMLAAEAALSIRLEEGTGGGEFGEVYPGWTWEGFTNRAEVNGIILTNLYQVEFIVLRHGELNSTMSILLYRPEGVSGRL